MKTLVAVAAACMASGACLAAERPASQPTPAADTTAPEDPARQYVYKKTSQGDLKMFINLPPGWQTGDRRPAILFFFGGAWQRGSTDQFLPQALYLASRGLVTARADYRVESRHGTMPDAAVEDARSAIRWLRQHAAELGIDPGRIIAAGGSAGGHLAACTALCDAPDAPADDTTVSCRPCALVLFNPVLDLKNIDLRGWKAAQAPGSRLVEDLSPLRHVTKDAPPIILFYGSEDRFLEHGRAMLARAKQLGVRAELYVAEGMPHGFFNRPPWMEITLRQTDAFLASLGYLMGEPTVALPAGATRTLRREQ